MDESLPTSIMNISCLLFGLLLGSCLIFGGCAAGTKSSGFTTSSEMVMAAEVQMAKPTPVAKPSSKIKPEKVVQIDAYCDPLNVKASADSVPDQIFADTADVYGRNSKWIEFESVDELEEFREESETFFITYNWFTGSRLTLTSFTVFSGSGDWAKYVRSCYRENGTLARVSIDYRTFYGDFRMVRSVYFAPKGSELYETKEFRRLDSEELFQPDQETIDENSSLASEDFFMNVKKIPYSKLLKKK